MQQRQPGQFVEHDGFRVEQHPRAGLHVARLRRRGEVFNAFNASRPLRWFSRCGGRKRFNFWLQNQLNAIALFDLYDDEKRALTNNSDLMPLAVRATSLIQSTRASAAARVRSLNSLLLGVLVFSLAVIAAAAFFILINLF